MQCEQKQKVGDGDEHGHWPEGLCGYVVGGLSLTRLALR